MAPPNKSASASVLDGRRMKLVNFAERRRGKDVQGYGSWSTGSVAVASYQIIKAFRCVELRGLCWILLRAFHRYSDNDALREERERKVGDPSQEISAAR